MFKRLLMTVALVATTFNVSAAKPQALPMPLGEQYPVEVVLNQQEIAVDVSATNPMAAGGGLLGALIVAGVDNARTKNAEERIVPLRDMLITYRFNEAMEQAIRAKVPSPGITESPAFNIQSSMLGAIDAQNRQQLAPYALVLTPRYAFDNKFHAMTVKITAQVVERSVKSNGKTKLAISFNRVYTHHVQLPAPGEVDDNVKAWQALGGPRLVELLDQAVLHSVDMLVFDFSREGRAEWGKFDRRASASIDGRNVPGIHQRAGEGWVWTRTGKGYLEALNGYQTAKAAPAAPASVPAEAEAAPATVPAAEAAPVPADTMP
ncbi:MAG: hypothetical protein KF800_05405 [Lysobacter sp.]|nr:hypothetical protein [Lysobacter sp.]